MKHSSKQHEGHRNRTELVCSSLCWIAIEAIEAADATNEDVRRI
jgi:hypothetical protein